jgi:hypothetical protein
MWDPLAAVQRSTPTAAGNRLGGLLAWLGPVERRQALDRRNRQIGHDADPQAIGVDAVSPVHPGLAADLAVVALGGVFVFVDRNGQEVSGGGCHSHTFGRYQKYAHSHTLQGVARYDPIHCRGMNPPKP